MENLYFVTAENLQYLAFEVDGYGLYEDCGVYRYVVAPSRGQAKAMTFKDEYGKSTLEFVDLRCRLLERDVDLPHGLIDSWDYMDDNGYVTNDLLRKHTDPEGLMEPATVGI